VELLEPPSLDMTVLLVLTNVPTVVGVTSTWTVQVPLAAIEPPENESVIAPAEGENIGEPQPDVPAFGNAATCRLAGNESLKDTPVMLLELGFVIVKVKVLLPPTEVDTGRKALLILGGPITVMVAEAVLPEPPSVEVTVLVVLVKTPAVVPVTFTLIVQVAPGSIVPPEKLMEVAPAEGEKDGEPHPPVVGLGNESTRTPEGNESLNETPVKFTKLPGGLFIVMTSVLVPFIGITEGEKPFQITGAAATARVEEA
jgi:hypothetical protein